MTEGRAGQDGDKGGTRAVGEVGSMGVNLENEDGRALAEGRGWAVVNWRVR